MANERRYVIDLEDIGNGLWRAKGFRTLVFDEYGLDKLMSIEDAVKEEADHAIERELSRRNIMTNEELEAIYARGKDAGIASVIKTIVEMAVSE